jgi:beta-lactamase regulating signal transducer with metallopeptidase domain/predicted Zn-dependent protease
MNSLMNFVFNVLWQTALISLVGFLLLKLFASCSAPKRSLLASSILIALVVLPLLTCVFMYTNIKTMKADSLAVPVFNYNTDGIEEKQTESILPVNNLITDKSAQVESEKNESSAISLPVISEQNISNAMTVVACIWGGGIMFMLGKLLYGLIFLRGFRFGLTLVRDEKISSVMKTALTVFNVSLLPEVYISSRVESPITIGVFKPIMILPESLYASLDENEIKSIILHEFSHIYHYDHLMGLVKRIAIAINWWNPLVYKISAKHSIAREEVSDNYVLSQLKPKIYSECLVGLAEKTCLISNLPATVGMADKHISLEKRIKNILSNKRKKEMKTGKNIKGIIYISTCFVAIFIGGIQYTFAHSPDDKKQEMDLRTYYKFSLKGRKLTPIEAKKLEEQVANNPDDLKAVAELLGYYWNGYIYNKNIREKKEKIILRLIDKHPESIILAWPEGQLDSGMNDCKPAIKLWEANVKKQPENLKILWNASRNLFLIDSKLAEKYLKKGQSLEPENMRWSKRLGFLYHLAGKYSDPTKKIKSYEEYKKVYGQTKINKLYTILPRLGKAAYLAEKYNDADKYAKEMLWRGENTVDVQDKAIFMYNANYLFGLLALKNGKTKEACKYLIKTGKILSVHKRKTFFPDMTLAYLLFLKNKHECVTEYLKLCFKYWNRNEYKKWLADVKIGLMPNFRSINYVGNYSGVLANIYSRRCYKLLSLGRKISAEEAKVLEKIVEATPGKKTYKVNDDITKLLGYYFRRSIRDKNIKAKKRKLIFQLIKNYPGSRVLACAPGKIFSYKKDKELISLWEAQIKKRPKAKYILANAASQLSLHDKKLAEQCLKKCQKLDPNNSEWSRKLGLLNKRSSKSQKSLKSYKRAYKIKKTDYILIDLGKAAVKAGKFKDAEKYANDMLWRAGKMVKKGNNYGDLIFSGNSILGLVALKNGNVEEACKYLLKSGKTPGSVRLKFGGPDMTLAKELFKKGKKECVIKFLESCSKVWEVKRIVGKDVCGIWIKQIKAGKTPKFNTFNLVNP